jgi:hypothetical protein
MTAFTADHDTGKRLRELDEQTRTAWEEYRSSLGELAGTAYEEAETVSWERLQQALHELADERERVVTTSSASDDSSE